MSGLYGRDTGPTSTSRARVDAHGRVSPRYAGTMRHLGIGRAHAGLRVRILREGAHTMVIDLATGELLAAHTIDPDLGYRTRRRRPR